MPSSAPLRRSSVVVGREAELDLVLRTLRAAPGQGTGCVVLVGEGGIGKTRLLAEATTAAHRLGCAVLAGRVPIATRPAFGLIASALRSWLRAAPTPKPMGAYDRGLATVLPEWPCPDGIILDDSQQRLLAFEGIVQLLRHITADLDGRLAVVRGDASRALTRAQSVLETQHPAIDDRLAALDLRARALDFVGERDEAERTWEQQAREAAGAGRTQAELRAVVQLGKIELFAGRPPRRLYEAVDRAREAGALVELGWAQENLGIGLCLLGQLEASHAVFDDAVGRCRALGLDQLAYLLGARGMTTSYVSDSYEADFAEAERLLPSVDLQLHLASMRADIKLRAGQYVEAVAWLQRCNELMASMPGVVPMDAPCWLVWAMAAAGRTDEGVVALDAAKAMPDLERWFGRPVVVAAAEALLAHDVDGLDAALAAAEARIPMGVALMRLLAAEILGGEGRSRWLRAALDWYESCGATAPADRVRQQLRDAGGSVPRRRAPKASLPPELASAGVTAREADVLRLLGDGLPNSEVAARLFVSVRTVEAHVSSLLAKLSARNRVQLASISTTTTWP